VRRESFGHCIEMDSCAGLRYVKSGLTVNPGTKGFTLNQSGTVLWHIFDDYISSPISQEPKERRRFFKLCNGVSYFDDASIAPPQQLNFISSDVFKEEPEDTVSVPGHRLCTEGQN
jgi:hypothetical protein